MRALTSLPTLPAALLCALLCACPDEPPAAEREAAVVVKAVRAQDAGSAPSAEEGAAAARMLPPLDASTPDGSPPRQPRPPPNAWVHVRTWASPETRPEDPLRTTSPRYVDERKCPDEARRAIAKLQLPQKRVNLCEVRAYTRNGEEQRVALLLYGKPRECAEGCVYERKTVVVKGKRVTPLDDVFFLPLPDADEALRRALPSAGVHLRLDAEMDERAACSPAPAVWLAEGDERRWGFEARYQDATCRVLSQLEEKGGVTSALLYELKVNGRATLKNALDEEWRPELTLTPIARRVVRFPKGVRASLENAPPLEILDEKLY